MICNVLGWMLNIAQSSPLCNSRHSVYVLLEWNEIIISGSVSFVVGNCCSANITVLSNCFWQIQRLNVLVCFTHWLWHMRYLVLCQYCFVVTYVELTCTSYNCGQLLPSVPLPNLCQTNKQQSVQRVKQYDNTWPVVLLWELLTGMKEQFS